MTAPPGARDAAYVRCMGVRHGSGRDSVLNPDVARTLVSAASPPVATPGW